MYVAEVAEFILYPLFWENVVKSNDTEVRWLYVLHLNLIVHQNALRKLEALYGKSLSSNWFHFDHEYNGL